MLPVGITSHFDNYCSHVLNITSFLFPSDVIYLGGWIKIFGLYIKKCAQLSISKLVRQLDADNNIYLFSVWLWINQYLSTRLVDLNKIKMYTVDKKY